MPRIPPRFLRRQSGGFEGLRSGIADFASNDATVPDRPKSGQRPPHPCPARLPFARQATDQKDAIVGVEELNWLEAEGFPYLAHFSEPPADALDPDVGCGIDGAPSCVDDDRGVDEAKRSLSIAAVRRCDGASHDLHVVPRHRPLGLPAACPLESRGAGGRGCPSTPFSVSRVGQPTAHGSSSRRPLPDHGSVSPVKSGRRVNACFGSRSASVAKRDARRRDQWRRTQPARSQVHERLPQRGQRVQDRGRMAPQCWQEGFGFTTIAQAFAPELPAAVSREQQPRRERVRRKLMPPRSTPGPFADLPEPREPL